MNAVLSGRAGIAVIRDGERCFRLEHGQEAWVETPREEHSWRFFGECRDLEFLEETDREAAERRLEEAVREADALDLVLTLLDATPYSDDTLRTAAEELEEHLSPVVRTAIEKLLLACPLPESVNIPRAFTFVKSTPKAHALLTSLVLLQPSIRKVHKAWLSVPKETFVEPGTSEILRHYLIRAGAFRNCVFAFHEGRVVSESLATAMELGAIQKLGDYRAVLTQWARALDASPVRPQPVVAKAQARTASIGNASEKTTARVLWRQEAEHKPLVFDCDSSLWRAVKRMLDACLALLSLLLAGPLLLFGAVLVKLTSRGPIFYAQTRLGLHGKPFTIFKLRTMLYNCEMLSGPQWSMPGDARVTPLGRLLRRTGIDELPQLWNVLKGDMSLVGPRPERPEFTHQLEKAIPCYGDRLLVRPGMTGLAQVQLPPDTDLASVRRKLAHDLYYVSRSGLWLDFRVLLFSTFNLIGIRTSISRRLLRLPGGQKVEHGEVGAPEKVAGISLPVAHLD